MTATHESTRKLVHIHSISFNSNKTFFTVCLEEGLRIYQTDPLELYQCLCWSVCGSVRVAEQLDSSCAVVMAGGGKRPKMPDNVAMLYNFSTNVFGARFKVPSPILNLLIRDDKLVMVMQREIEVYDVSLFPLNNIQRGVTYTTCPNDKGLCQMSRDFAEQHVLCYPGTTEGSVQIVVSTRL
ncbi:SVP1-like protein 2 [Hyalella azteca]|uniref:SVP1-like protein 2 n=1 Tax=Hyalella azteca TaxID=294128 RepID=A0A8B7PGY8_HYAAZ|nr:SVP1-like protein 2 [Hyalella azteca]